MAGDLGQNDPVSIGGTEMNMYVYNTYEQQKMANYMLPVCEW